jgi:hypothetical protein
VSISWLSSQNILLSSVKDEVKETKCLFPSSWDSFFRIDRWLWNSYGRKPILQASVTDSRSVKLSKPSVDLGCSRGKGRCSNQKYRTQWLYDHWLARLVSSSLYNRTWLKQKVKCQLRSTGALEHSITITSWRHTYVEFHVQDFKDPVKNHCCPQILKLSFFLMTTYREQRVRRLYRSSKNSVSRKANLRGQATTYSRPNFDTLYATGSLVDIDYDL